MTGTITPWYLTPEALVLLADCAESEPVVLHYDGRDTLTGEDWRTYDDEDPRVRRLASIASEVLEPLLQDNELYRLAPAAGSGVSVDNAIDAVCAAPNCARDHYEIEEARQIAAQIAAAMDRSMGEAA